MGRPRISTIGRLPLSDEGSEVDEAPEVRKYFEVIWALRYKKRAGVGFKKKKGSRVRPAGDAGKQNEVDPHPSALLPLQFNPPAPA